MEHRKEEKKEESIEIKIPKLDSLRKNPWIISTVILAIILIVLLAMGSLSFGGGGVGEKKAADNLLSYISSLGQGEAIFVESVKEEGFYKVTVKYNGQDIPVYVSLDGKNLVTGKIPLAAGATNTPSQTQQETPTEVPKSDKPKVELFVMSYCPYGTQAEKGILPVFALLGNKIDGKIRFVHYTMHGEKEDTENFRQLCIREEQGTKFNAYLQCILNSTSQTAPGDVNACMKKLGINVASVDSCIKGKAKDYYAVDSELSQGYGVQGSPTLVINGVEASSARSPAVLLKTICSAFNTAPSECSQTLPSSNPSAGFGYSSSGADSAAAACGV